MKLFELTEYLSEQGIKLQVQQGKLSIAGAQDRLTDELISSIWQYKAELAEHHAEQRLHGYAQGEDGPLSLAQGRLFFLYQLHPQATHFNMPVELRLRGELDAAQLIQAFEETMARHAIYRTTYEVREGTPWQRHRPELSPTLLFRDLSASATEDKAAALASLRHEISERPFALESEAPLRGCLLRLDADEYALLLTFHHIATDEWSIRLLLRELAERYRALRQGRPAQHAQTLVGYLDFAQWQSDHVKRGGYQVGRSFWQHELSGHAGLLGLPADHQRPATPDFDGHVLRRPLPKGFRARREHFVRQQSLSDFSFHLAVFYLLLHQLTGETDIVVGTDTFGRDLSELDGVAGFFVNQLALRGRLDLRDSFAECAAKIFRGTLRALSYQSVPFDRVIEDVLLERDETSSPLFQVKFLYHAEDIDYQIFDHVTAHLVDAFPITSQYDLTQQIVGDTVSFFYRRNLFDQASVERWLDIYFELMNAVLREPSRPLGELLHERMQARLQPWCWGSIKPEASIAGPYRRFLEVAAANPERIAVSSAQDEISYAQLQRRIHAIGHHLSVAGIGPGSRVALHLERSVDLVAALMAAMHLGATFVPVDPDYPAEQVDFMLEDSDAAVVITEAAASLACSGGPGLILDIADLVRSDMERLPPAHVEPARDDCAYLLYTSGSTGRPKGVEVSHGALANLCDWYLGFAHIDAASRVLLMIPISFDASIKNILAPLMTGGELVLAPTGWFDPPAVLRLLQQRQVSLINCAPSAFYGLLKACADDSFAELSSLSLLALGGESLDLQVLGPWLRSERHQARLANIYGPTECADISLAHIGDRAHWLDRGSVTVGRPIQNVSAYIVDSDLRLCAPGALGELLIGGRCVGLGYHRLPNATAEAFLDAGEPFGRVYRTGDFCRYDSAGNIIYLGRRDGQLKVRGKRIESAQIVHHIQQQLPGSRASIQLYDREGMEVLLAFIEGRVGAVDEDGLLDYLRQQLPRHMVPRRVLWMDAFALTSNGKVSRMALLDFYESHKVEAAPPETLNAMEELIASVWREILDIDAIGKQADFFSLGGDSILSIQVVAELAHKGIALSVADVFRYATLEQLAAHCSQLPLNGDVPEQVDPLEPFALLSPEDSASLPAGLEDAYPATPLQLAMLFHAGFDETGGIYHDVFSFELNFPYDPGHFRSAADCIVARHGALRTRFDTRSFSVPMQLVQAEVAASIDDIDLLGMDDEAQRQIIRRHIEDVKRDGFQPDAHSLIRFSVFKRGEDHIQLVIDAHHAILDGWSMATLQRQLFETYWGTLRQHTAQPHDAASKGLRFADYVAEQVAEQRCEESAAYWKEYCATLGSEDPLKTCPQGALVRQAREVNAALLARLRTLSASLGVPLKTLFFVAHAQMLRGLASSDHLLTAVTDNGRPEAEHAQHLVGLFLNTLPVALDFRHKRWRELVMEAHRGEVERKPFRKYPYASIVKSCPAAASSSLFTFTNFHVLQGMLDDGRLKARLDEVHEQTDFQLSTLVSNDGGDGVVVHVSANLALGATHVSDLMEGLMDALAAMAEDIDAPVPQRQLPWLPPHTALMQEEGTAVVGCLRVPRANGCDAHVLRAWLTGYAALIDSAQMPVLLELAQLQGDEAAAIALAGATLRTQPSLSYASFTQGDWSYLLLRAASPLSQRDWSMLGGGLLECCRMLSGTRPEVLVGDHGGLAWHAAGALDACARFWRRALGRPGPLALPVDHPLTARSESAFGSYDFVIPQAIAETMHTNARATGMDPRYLLLSAWASLLGRLGAQDEVALAISMGDDIETIGQPVRDTLLTLPWATASDQLSLCRLAQTALAQAWQQHPLSLAQIADLIGSTGGSSSLFQAAFAFGVDCITDAIELGLSVVPRDQSWVCRLSFDDGRFERSSIERWVAHLIHLLEAAAASPQRALTSLPLLSASECQALYGASSAMTATQPVPAFVHQCFEEQAACTPDAVALVYEGDTISYAELNARANRLAHALIALGVKPEARVGLCMQRSMGLVVGILGVLKAGGAYVPLDPDYPAERLAFMLSDSAPSLVVGQVGLESALAGWGGSTLMLDEQGHWPGADASSATDPLPAAMGLQPGHLAYVIYTSGSTGAPKGVLVEHRQLRRLFEASAPLFAFGPHDTWTMFHSCAFDFSVWELWGALAHGGRLVVVPAWIARSPEAFHRLLCAERVSVLNQTPTAFIPLTQVDAQAQTPLSLRLVIFGGEALKLSELRDWVTRHGDESPALINMYGITETTVHVTYRRLRCEDIASGNSSLIGRPLSDLSMRLLDAHGNAVPAGVAGEIHVSGAGVARGYHQRTELTAERFVAHADAPGERLYRSGDLARLLPSGEFEYLGRIDNQVKIRGFRIELGEIEYRLSSLPWVSASVVVVREDMADHKQLVGYVVPADGADKHGLVEACRNALLATLPAYMVPAALVTLPALPLTRNGKVDRDKLPAPTGNESTAPYTAPRNDAEAALCEVWQAVLQCGQVGALDNYFSLGGDSILSIRTVSMLGSRGWALDIKDLFQHQTVARIAPCLRREQGAEPSESWQPFAQLQEQERARYDARYDDAYPMSSLQAGMVFHTQAESFSGIYHDIIADHVRCPWDRGSFEQALASCIAEHPILRTGFRLDGERPLQHVHVEQPLPLEVFDLREHDSAWQEQHLAEWLERRKRHVFDWSDGPLVHFHVFLRTLHSFEFAISFHHAVLDGWSRATLATSLYNRYMRLLSGLAVDVAAVDRTYARYVALEQRTLASGAAREYFIGQLHDTSAVQLRRLQDDVAARAQRRIEVEAFAPLSGRLIALAKELGVPLQAVLLAAHFKVLSSLSGLRKVVSCVTHNGRPEAEGAERSLGLYLNSVPQAMELPVGSWREFVHAVARMSAEGLAHRSYPLSRIQHDLARTFSEVLFNYTHFHVFREMASGPNGTLEILGSRGFEQTNFDLLVDVARDASEDRLRLQLVYDPQIYSHRLMEQWQRYFLTACERIVSELDDLHDARPLMDESEWHGVVSGWNGHVTAKPYSGTIHEHFEQQVARTPEAVALICEGETISYAALNARANRLAHALIALGVKPEARVGLCMQRSAGMVVGILGVLKAGGAYVPLDPDYPADRLAYMLSDSAPSVVVGQKGLESALAGWSGNTLMLDEQGHWPDAITYPASDPQPSTGLQPGHLSYVIYTSGSTGVPKGVMNQHDGVVNRLCWARDEYRLAAHDVALLKTPYSFDVSVGEIFLPLFSGARLLVARPDGHRLPSYLRDVLVTGAVTTVHFVPSMLQQFLNEAEGVSLPSLRRVFCSGEALGYALQYRFQSMFPGVELHNLYGPTEAAIEVTSWRCDERKIGAAVPIGRPIANTQIYLLDGSGHPVPIGVPGELHIGGIGVARGYLNRPELTADRFVEDRFGGRPGARLYRTGDIVRRNDDGVLEYLGRNDFQVKLRGVRIELGEIEAALLACAGVREAAVTVHESEGGDRRLVAYVVSEQVGGRQLREQLLTRLAEHMIPNAYVQLDALPLTVSGKLDRQALPAPDASSLVTRPYEAPQGETELALAAIWGDLLGVQQVGRQDDFFELGGHSLLVTQCIVRIRQAFEVDLPIASLFNAPTLATVAEVVVAERLLRFSAQDVLALGEDLDDLSDEQLRLLLQQERDDMAVDTTSGSLGLASGRDE